MSRHRFINCIPSNLKAFMQNKESLPMNFLMENEEAEMTRLTISHAIAHQVCNRIQVEGLKGLIVHVILKVYVTEREEEVASILREMKMTLVQRNLYMGEWKSGSSSTFVGDEEVCVVCLEEMVEGGKEVICTPCKHQFHAGCIRQWFEKCVLFGKEVVRMPCKNRYASSTMMMRRKGRIRHIKAFTGMWAFISCHVCGSMVAITSSLSDVSVIGDE